MTIENWFLSFPSGRSKRFLVAVAAMLLIMACGSDSRDIGSNGRVNGRALAGPTCPVERPGDLSCQSKPVQGKVQFAQRDKVVGSVPINADGSFTLEIPEGTYTVTVDIGDNIFPICSPVVVEVRANFDAFVEITCDTGIR